MKKITTYLFCFMFLSGTLLAQDLTNGDFELGTPGGNAFILNNVDDWSASHGTPGLGSTGCDNQYAWMWSIFNAGEGIFSETQDFLQGKTYRVDATIKIRDFGINAISDNARILIKAASGLSVSSSTVIPVPASEQIIASIPFSDFTDDNCAEISICFTADANYDQFWVYPLMTIPSQNGHQAELSIDNIEIERQDPLDPSFILLGVSPPGWVAASQHNLYTGLDATHEWSVFYTRNNGGGPYQLRLEDTGPQFNFHPTQDGWYVVIHKVITLCEEACYSQIYYVGSPFEQFDCESEPICETVDCSLLDFLGNQGPCEGKECEKMVSSNKEESIIIFPNPGSDYLNLERTKTDFYQIEIIDIFGTVVFSSTNKGGKARINLNYLAKGIYFVRILEQGDLVDTKMWLKE